jgi:DNA-binding PadR family transcriptional regulator
MPADIPSFFENPSKASLSYLLLMLISYTPLHGYILVQEIEKHTEGQWKPSHSAVYKLLNDLEDDGYISSWEDKDGERSKRIYKITDKGLALLAEAERNFESFINAFISSLLVAKDIINPDNISVLLTNKGKEIVKGLDTPDRLRILSKLKVFLDEESTRVNQELEAIKSGSKPEIVDAGKIGVLQAVDR